MESSEERIFKEGVPQGSPLSPFLFILATASLPRAITAAAPDCRSVQYADDLTIRNSNPRVEVAREGVQAALDATSRWCAEHYLDLAPEKTEALLVSTHPGEVNNKLAPPLTVANQPVRYNTNPRIFGVTLDGQMSFAAHARVAVASVTRRLRALRAIAARNWGASADTLRQIYTAFVRPAGLFAAEAWWGFLPGPLLPDPARADELRRRAHHHWSQRRR